MTDDAIDFGPLDVSLEDLVRRVDVRCAAELASRRRHRALIQIAGWRRPIVSAALAIAAASAYVIARTPARVRSLSPVAPIPFPGILTSRPPVAQLASTLGVPSALASRLTRAAPPTMDQLLSESER